MAQPDFSIIIVNWRVRDLLEKCLNSLQRFGAGENWEVIVVDNDSRDSTAEMLMLEYPEVKMIGLPRNYGFARANNFGIKKAQGRYIFLLNPDTEITANFFPVVKDYLDHHPEIGILGPKLLNPDGSLQYSVRRSPDLLSQVLTLLKLQNIIINQRPLDRYLTKKFTPLVLKLREFFSDNKILPYYLAGDFDYNKSQPVEQLMGAALVIRREVFEKIGLLDEKFYIWFEEVDFCRRAWQAGMKVFYLAEATVVHYGGESFNKRTALRKQLIFDHSVLYYFFKHQPWWQTLIILAIIPLNLLLTIIYVCFLQRKSTA